MANTSHSPPAPVWHRFSHPMARDLAWIIASPALMAGRLESFVALELDQDTRGHCLEWLARLEKRFPETLAVDSGRFRRLGLYFEALAAFLFSRGWEDGAVPYRLLSRNIRVPATGTTVGELDMLLEDRQGGIIHLECAVKFYLAHQPHTSNWQNWIGPNGSDRLDLKLRRMLDHQLRLARHPAAGPVLRSHHLATDAIEPRYLLRGMFFPHAESNLCLPANANPEVLTGRWLTREQFTRRYGTQPRDWRTLEKLEWLTGSPGGDRHITRLPKMLCRPDGGRMILVEDYWPETSSPSRKM